MDASSAGRPFRSRFQVLSDESPAWALDDKGTLYRFDGLRFSRWRERGESFSIVPSWQTPSYGWLCQADCPCSMLVEVQGNGLQRAGRQSASELFA